jgi:hypothetical protein
MDKVLVTSGSWEIAVRLPWGAKDFFFLQSAQTDPEVQQTFYLTNTVSRSGREAGHGIPLSAKVKKNNKIQ